MTKEQSQHVWALITALNKLREDYSDRRYTVTQEEEKAENVITMKIHCISVEYLYVLATILQQNTILTTILREKILTVY